MDSSAPEAQGVAARQLAQSLALDAGQREALAPSFEQVDGREPGALWRLAAAMQKTLTTEQKENLLEQAQRPPRERGMRGERGPRGGRPDSVAMQGRPGRGPRGGMRDSLATPGHRGNREAMGQAMRTSMVEALALTPEQQEQLEALHTTQREAMKTLRDQHREAGDAAASREAFETLRNAHKAALESIYTEAQREIIAIHRALAAGQAARGDRRGPRGPR